MGILQLQMLSTVAKSARSIVMKYPVLCYRNMLDHFSRLYEIEKTSPKRLKITENLKNESSITKVFQKLPFLQSLLISERINRKSIHSLVKSMANYRNINEIIVPEYNLSRWQKITSKLARCNNHIKIIAETIYQENHPEDMSSITENPLLLGGLDRQSFYIAGILQEGNKNTLYKMDSPSNFFYRMIDVYSCKLPSNKGNLSWIKEAPIFFSLARALIEDVVEKFDNLDEFKTDVYFENWLGCQSPKTHDLYFE